MQTLYTMLKSVEAHWRVKSGRTLLYTATILSTFWSDLSDSSVGGSGSFDPFSILFPFTQSNSGRIHLKNYIKMIWITLYSGQYNPLSVRTSVDIMMKITHVTAYAMFRSWGRLTVNVTIAMLAEKDTFPLSTNRIISSEPQCTVLFGYYSELVSNIEY